MKIITKSLSATLLLSSLFYFSQQKTNALANTEWKGVANIPTPAEVTFKFNTDQADLVYQGNVIEKMSYSFTDQGSLKLVKLEGNSPCDSKEEGLYKYQIVNDTLTFMIINDKCMERQTAFDGNGYKKVTAAAIR
ncbi:hypothetical protein [Epilithonimonas sp. UC225_85]|uniref:hypothetical protein n=1 Tax=Epilithonimonas sp. UC225_85 TaxID=3350167 RepID=UPI0036D215D2